MNENNIKRTKREQGFKGFSCTYNFGILNFFDPEHTEYTESAIKNIFKKLLSQLRGFKFMTTLVLVFKKIESKDKIFIQGQKQR